MPTLIKCKACGADVSSDAQACPHCGHPLVAAKRARSSNSGCAVVLLVLLALFVYGLFKAGSGSSSDVSAGQTPSATAPPPADCEKDLQCIGEKLVANVAILRACRHSIDATAKNDSKWDDGVLNPPFVKYAWDSTPGANVTLLGDRVQFQNGFGNFMRMTYACTVDPVGGAVIKTRVFQGKLPE